VKMNTSEICHFSKIWANSVPFDGVNSPHFGLTAYETRR
jgi:hypothetical protein